MTLVGARSIDAAVRAVVDAVDPLECERLDADDEFPENAVTALTEIGLERHYVPARLGGELVDYERTGRLVRTVAGLDLTVAIAHGKTYLGGVCVWTAGSPELGDAVGRLIMEGHPVSWALTERAHGSDLLAGDVIAEEAAEDGVPGYRLAGEKWLINNATRGTALCVLARTSFDGGTRGYSLFLVDKRDLAPGASTPLPKEHTLGIRGADISGIRFDGAFVPGDRMVGPPGWGLEIVLQSMQITRTMCCYLSMGASDHASVIATRFAAGRTLYGHRLTELPAARAVLADALAVHLLAEAVTTIAARSINVMPQEMSALGAVAKYLVPSMTEESLIALRRLTGARSLVAGSTPEGTLAKIERDHRLVSLFDGNTMVNLTTLVTQFPTLLWRRVDTRPDEADALRAVADLTTEPGEPDLGRLTLVARRGLTVLRHLSEDLRFDDVVTGLSDAAAAELRDGVDTLRDELERLRVHTAQSPRHPVETPVAAFESAARLAACAGAASALALWAHSRERVDPTRDPLWHDGVWVRLALHAAVGRLGRVAPLPDHLESAAVDALLRSADDGSAPTLLPTEEARR